MAIIVTMTSANGLNNPNVIQDGGVKIKLYIQVQNQSASSVTLVGAQVFSVPAFAPVLIGQLVIPAGGINIPGLSTITLPNVAVTGFLPQQFGQTATSPQPPQFVGTVTVSDGSTGSSPALTIPVGASLNPPANSYGVGNSQLLPGSLVNTPYYNPSLNTTLRYDGTCSFVLIFPGSGLGLL